MFNPTNIFKPVKKIFEKIEDLDKEQEKEQEDYVDIPNTKIFMLCSMMFFLGMLVGILMVI